MKISLFIQIHIEISFSKSYTFLILKIFEYTFFFKQPSC